MRQIKDTGNEEDRVKVANEAAYLYAPLAHKLWSAHLENRIDGKGIEWMDVSSGHSTAQSVWLFERLL